MKASFHLNSMRFFFEVAVSIDLTNGACLAHTVVEGFVRLD